ncbi:MAG TPA: Gfo/Idh/MocA family oxidoreductase, partial [Verrucomicrobiae bacterium]|nr:Gfo/Idh/MocA family oxidoreductase [Verrucomicrobiae bacterium]
MAQNKLRWGILGAANIARKNWKAIRNAGNSTVVAVASRDPKCGRRFMAECQAEAPMEDSPRACTYEELLAAKDVDAVYIPLPTGIRKEWVIRFAEAGKHIVCEKPCALTVADLREMLDACHNHKVQFMDGVMFMHSRRLERLGTVLDDQKIVGRIKRITSAFSFLAEEDFFSQNIRASSILEPHGCLGDLGWYCIRLALTLMREELPRRVTGRILTETVGRNSPAPVATEFSGELLFEDGVSSSFYCSFLSANEQWAQITGDAGCVHMSDFVLPFFGNEVAFETIAADFNVKGCD